MARLGKARRVTFLYKKGFIVKAGRGKAGRGKARRGKARLGTARRGKARRVFLFS